MAAYGDDAQDDAQDAQDAHKGSLGRPHQRPSIEKDTMRNARRHERERAAVIGSVAEAARIRGNWKS